MSLSPGDLRKLKDAFNELAQKHPYPDKPVVAAGYKKISVRDLAKEIENETPVGKPFIKLIDDVVTSGAVTLDAVVAQIARKPPAP